MNGPTTRNRSGGWIPTAIRNPKNPLSRSCRTAKNGDKSTQSDMARIVSDGSGSATPRADRPRSVTVQADSMSGCGIIRIIRSGHRFVAVCRLGRRVACPSAQRWTCGAPKEPHAWRGPVPTRRVSLALARPRLRRSAWRPTQSDAHLHPPPSASMGQPWPRINDNRACFQQIGLRDFPQGCCFFRSDGPEPGGSPRQSRPPHGASTTADPCEERSAHPVVALTLGASLAHRLHPCPRDRECGGCADLRLTTCPPLSGPNICG